MGARAAIAGTILALLGGLTSAAQAAPAVSKPAPVVVTSSAGADLLVSDEAGGQLCLEVRAGGGENESCDTAALGTVVVGGPSSSELFVGVAVPPSSTAVEVRRDGQLLAAGPTVAGDAYRGKRAGKVRFALLALPAGTASDGLRVRALDASGALVAVLASSTDAALVFDRHRLLSGRYGPTRWSIDASRSSELTPSVVDVAHETVGRCTDISTRQGSSKSSSGSCIGESPRDSLQLLGIDPAATTEDSCSPQFRLLHGIVDASVRAVTFLLGDGRRRAARLAPMGDGAHLVYALPIPHDAAVRSMTFDRGGAGSQVRRLGMAPLAINCATAGASGWTAYGPALDAFGTLDSLPTVTPAGPVTTVAGTPSFRVADGPGDSLCLALGDKPFNAFGCAVVSPAFDELLGAFDSYLAPRSFAIVVPARVAAVRIAAADGKTVRTIPTVPATGYAGRYDGYVRFAAATVGATRELSSLDLLDAAGAVLHSERDSTTGADDEAPHFAGRQRVAGRAGHPSLWQTNLRTATSTTGCLALTAGPPPTRAGSCQGDRTPPDVLLHASCVSHRLTVAVVAREGTRVEADGYAIRLRQGAGLLTLPSKRALRSLTFTHNGKTSRVRIDAPAGAKQCGWNAAPSISLRRSA